MAARWLFSAFGLSLAAMASWRGAARLAAWLAPQG